MQNFPLAGSIDGTEGLFLLLSLYHDSRL
jgi:hypothetical protein